METHAGENRTAIQIDDLELLTDLLMNWCRHKGRDPEELLPKCYTILERFRSGISEPNQLFDGL